METWEEAMTIKVIGAGYGRTGTLSLKAALETLEFGKCYHMIELLQNPEGVQFWEDASQGKPVNWKSLFEGYQAIVDFPGCSFYEELMQYYPDAKVVLTVRDPQAWYESSLNTIYRAGPQGIQKLQMTLQLPFSAKLRRIVRVFRLADQLYWQGEFQGKFEDKEYAIGCFQQHIEAVKQVVPSEQLLVYEVKEGWEPLCRFLNVPVPLGQPFPRLNERETFGQMSRQLMK